ncbi:hypothetical protein HK096_010324, partial [Nowakowskiella sp. JEL0078]
MSSNSQKKQLILPAEKLELRQLSGAFKSFLNDAINFYIQFITILAKVFSLERVEKVVLRNWDLVPDVALVN